jgi:lipopolysaccharide transport protein LptA
VSMNLICAILLLGAATTVRLALSEPSAPSGASATMAVTNESVAVAANTNATDITSKQLRMDTDKKIAYFDGDVGVIDPQFLLRSNRLIVFMNPNGSGMDRAEAYEDVVIVQEAEKRKARCQKAVYTPADGKMVLTGNPEVESTSGVTHGQVITIFRTNNVILVEGSTQTRISLSDSTSRTNAPAATSTNAAPKLETK